MAAQGLCLGASSDVGAEVLGVKEWGALSGKFEQCGTLDIDDWMTDLLVAYDCARGEASKAGFIYLKFHRQARELRPAAPHLFKN